MPNYVFKCVDCDEQVEVLRPYTDSTPFHCPICNSVRLVQQYSKMAIIYKSDGFTKRVNHED